MNYRIVTNFGVLVHPADQVKLYGIALTGGMATGKSLVASFIRQAGFPVIDADQLARIVVEPGREGLLLLKREFGDSIIADSGLDRAELRRIIAADPKARSRVGEILHPLIRQAYFEQLIQLNLPAGHFHFYEAALIYENGLQNDFYQVWLCDCSEATQLSRIVARDHGSLNQAKALLSMQWSREAKLKQAQIVINTEETKEMVEKNTVTLIEQLKGAP